MHRNKSICCIFACISQNHRVAAGMFVQEGCYIVDLASDNDPTTFSRRMFLNLRSWNMSGQMSMHEKKMGSNAPCEHRATTTHCWALEVCVRVCMQHHSGNPFPSPNVRAVQDSTTQPDQGKRSASSLILQASGKTCDSNIAQSNPALCRLEGSLMLSPQFT